MVALYPAGFPAAFVAGSWLMKNRPQPIAAAMAATVAAPAAHRVAKPELRENYVAGCFLGVMPSKPRIVTVS